jgi:transketolase
MSLPPRVAKAEHATRRAFSERMVEYGRIDRDFVVFEADIGYSTYSYLFGEAFPDRYFNMGIAESNAVAAAAGMASCGRTVVACSYGVFLTMRAVETVRTFICYPNLNVKLLSSHGGITPAIDGVTHQASEDIAFMTTLPNMKVLAPADTVSSRKLFDVCLRTPGPVFVRLMRDPLFDVYRQEDVFEMGGSKRLMEGDDVTIVTYGDLVFQAIAAAEELITQGIKADVLDFYSIKPFDEEALRESLARTGCLVVAENHQRRNGLGYELAHWCLLNHPAPFENLGLEDTFAESGNYYKLLDKYGLSKDHIIQSARRVLARKGT